MRTSTNTSSFIALAPIPIFIIDPYSLKLEYANARFLDLVNGSLQEIEGLIINDILGQDLSLAISAFFLQLENASNNTSIPVQIPDIESNITPFSSYSYFASTFEEAHGTKLKIAVWLIAKTKVTTEPDISITSDQTLVKQESGKEVLSDMKPTEKRPNIEYVQAVGESQQIETDNLLISNGDIKKSESAEAQQALSETWIELETSREWFKNMVHSSPVAMLITKGEDMVFDVINNAMLNLIGRDSSVLGKPWFEAIPELVGQPVVDELFYAYRTGLAHHLPGVGISLIKNGESTLGYYDLTYTPLKENGKVIGLMQTATEPT